MIVYRTSSHDDAFYSMFREMQYDLTLSPPVEMNEWQSQRNDVVMRELLHVAFSMVLPRYPEQLANITGAHLSWAEDHFQERISGRPMNPSPSEAWWPFAQKGNAAHKSEGEAFSHTYPERMWPKMANVGGRTPTGRVITAPHVGLRFEYGDLTDVVTQLFRSPTTRQAFLPIWFPEDTGAVNGQRVPCTLGYHFLIRNGKLDITYFMRSTDLLRHFQDDIYMAGRLAQEVVEQLKTESDRPLQVGDLHFHTANLHVFEGDVPMMKIRHERGEAWTV